MPKLSFTPALKRFFPNIEAQDLEAVSLKELVMKLEEKYPGITSYLLDESGALRKHVNIFIGDELLKDRLQLSDRLQAEDEVLIFQALSGG